MLTRIKSKTRRAEGGDKFAILAARFNPKYVDALVAAAVAEFKRAGAKPPAIIRVPGSFEIPSVASALAARRPRYAAIICFGVILRGATTHAEHIAQGVTHALAQLQIIERMPIVHGVLLFENEEQARVRCLGEEHNRGTEAAHVALEMAQVMRTLQEEEGGP